VVDVGLEQRLFQLAQGTLEGLFVILEADFVDGVLKTV